MKYVGRDKGWPEYHTVSDGEWDVWIRRSEYDDWEPYKGDPEDGFTILRRSKHSNWLPVPQEERLEIIMTAWPMVDEP